MLGSVLAQQAEQLGSSRRLVEISLVKPKSDCFAAKHVSLMSEFAFITAENFKNINLLSHDMLLLLDQFQFLFRSC